MPLAIRSKLDSVLPALLLPILAAAAIATATVTDAAAQDRRELSELSENATVTARTVAELSFAGLEVAPDALARVFALPDGGWAVGSNVFNGVIVHFDSAGTAAGTFGGPGEGPGELGGEVFGQPVGGDLWIVDPANARLHVFSSDFSLEADRRLPGRVFSASPSKDGRSILVSGFLYRGDETLGVARLTLDEAEDVFGGEIADDPNPRSQIHMAAEAANGEVWTVAVSGGAVNVLDGSDLSMLDRLRLPGGGLTWAATPGPRDPSEPRPAHLAGVTADAVGRVWVAIGVPDRNWTPEISLDDGAERVLDTLVLVIDAERRAVVGRTRLDEICLPVDGSRVSCVDELGERIRILELRL